MIIVKFDHNCNYLWEYRYKKIKKLKLLQINKCQYILDKIYKKVIIKISKLIAIWL